MDLPDAPHGARGRSRRRNRDIPIRTRTARPSFSLLLCLPLLACLACGTTSTDIDEAGTGGATACRPATPCPDGWFAYSDSLCSPPSLGSGPGCSSNGDGLCYKSCSSDDDCRNTGFSSCGSLTFYQGSDVGRPRPACVALPATSAPPICGNADAAAD